MNKQFKKYRYLGNVYPEVPEPWMPIILTMLKDIDKKVRSKLIPKFLLNSIYDSSLFAFSSYMRTYWKLHLQGIIGEIEITQIKQKFATLRVNGSFLEDVQSIVNLAIDTCNNTCEFCGAKETTNIMIKSWVRCVCNECKEKHKK